LVRSLADLRPLRVSPVACSIETHKGGGFSAEAALDSVLDSLGGVVVLVTEKFKLVFQRPDLIVHLKFVLPSGSDLSVRLLIEVSLRSRTPYVTHESFLGLLKT
jgi:hypothetical protein